MLDFDSDSSPKQESTSIHVSLPLHIMLTQLIVYLQSLRGRFMVFCATFNNISVISWQSVLLMEKTREPGETTDLSQVTDKLYHIVLYRVHLTWAGFELTTLVVICTDCIGSYKSIHYMIMATTASSIFLVCNSAY